MEMQLSLDNPQSGPERLQLRLALLACEREQLRASGGSRELLERNRLEIGRCQYEFSHELVRRHLGSPVEQAA